MESDGQHDRLRVILTLPQYGRGSACMVVTHELWVVLSTLSGFSHFFKGTATSKSSVEFITWYPQKWNLEVGVSARDFLGGCWQEGGEWSRAGKMLNRDVVLGAP